MKNIHTIANLIHIGGYLESKSYFQNLYNFYLKSLTENFIHSKFPTLNVTFEDIVDTFLKE